MKKFFVLFVFIISLMLVFSSVDAVVYKKPVRSSISPFDKGVCPSCVSKKSMSKSAVVKQSSVAKKLTTAKAPILPRCEDITRFYPGKHYLSDCSMCPGYACDGPVKLAVNQGGKLLGYVKCFDCKLRSERMV